ncbi:DUF3566 domain-containing protein [Mycolicibacterium vaccae]|uniref:DUF3566 domain-containing protein n=1 Tax=Mycolicibacterium vaccae TaxID=1810 RepID=UPI003D08C653
MSAPNEPGHPRTSDPSSGGNGSPAPAAGQDGTPSGTGSPSGTDVPPWQRGPAARARQQNAAEAGGPESRQGNPPQGLDARLNRFMGGGGPETDQGSRPEPGPRPDAPPHRPEAPTRAESPARPEAPTRAEAPHRPESGNRPEPYGSEIPDLSGGAPRSPQRKPADRPAPEQRPRQGARPATPSRGVEVASRQHRGPLRASMQIRRIDPWSTLKVSLLLSVALFFVWMIAVAFLYLVLGGMGVWTKLNSNVGDLLTSASGTAGGELVSSGTVFGGAALIGLVNIVLLSAAATIGAFIYNLTTDLVGGVEVTLADRD